MWPSEPDRSPRGHPLNPLSLLESAPLLAPVIGVLVGVALGVSPLAWPMAVVTVATGVAASDEDRPSWRPVAAVGVGITLVYATLGLGVESIDQLIRQVLGATAGIGLAVLAALSILTGAFLLARPLAVCRMRTRTPRGSSAGAVAVGAILSAVTCPACAGIITGVAVTAAAAWGWISATLAMVGLGVGHTLALIGLLRLLTPVTATPDRLRRAQRVSGATLVAVGLFFTWQATGMGLTVAEPLP